MIRTELINEVLALPAEDQTTILKLLQERLKKNAGSPQAGVTDAARMAPPARGEKKNDPWGGVYQELTKTFRAAKR